MLIQSLGGTVGYVKTKSLPSIIAGWSVGLLCEWCIQRHEHLEHKLTRLGAKTYSADIDSKTASRTASS